MNTSVITNPIHQRWVLFSIAFAAFMTPLDTYIVNISLPTMAADFNVGISLVSRVVLVYLLILTSTILLFGKLGDRIGLIRVLISGFVVFTFGSLLCGLSRSLPQLIGARCIQALGGAMLYAITPGIIPRYLPPTMRGAAFGILTTSAALGVSLGAPLGGLITAYLSWHWIFLINIPFGIMAILVIHKVFPPEPARVERRERFRFDIMGVALNFFGLCTLLYALNMGQEHGWTSPLITGCFTAAAIFLTSFILWETRCRDPLLALGLFRNRYFTTANLANLLAFMFMAGNGFLLPFYLIHAQGLRTDQAGLFMMLFSVTLMIIGPLAGRLSDRGSPRLFCIAGMASATLASLVFALVLGMTGLWLAAACIIWMGFSYGVFVSPNNSQVMSWADSHHQGIASGVLKMTANLGQAIGVCLFETVFSQCLPPGIPMTDAAGSFLALGSSVAFRNAYVMGSLVCASALIASLLARDRRQPSADAPESFAEFREGPT